jgi:hypothetical protein
VPAAAWAQDVKNEVETSITREQMPEKALSLLSPLLKEVRKPRFYRETDGQEVSYESKLKWKGDAYSIEFKEDGSLMDAEKQVRYNTLPEEVRREVESYLEKEFGRYRIRRVQAQYSAGRDSQSGADVLQKLAAGEFQELTVRYEMEVDGTLPSELGAFEILFDAKGNLVNRRRVVRRSADNILY